MNQCLRLIVLTTLMAFSLFGCTSQKSQQQSQNLKLQNLGEAPALSPAVAASEGAPTQLHVFFEKVGDGLDLSMRKCPERIWPGFDFKKINVLLLAKGHSALVWRGNSGKLEPIDENQVPAGARQGLYSFLQWQGQDTVSIYLDEAYGNYYSTSAPPTSLIALIVHEAFHTYGQKNWITSRGHRGTQYPVVSTPRLYRRLMFDYLKEALEAESLNQSELSKATFWFQKWKLEFPTEFDSTTDGYEGTAQYVDMMSSAIVDLGCEASDVDLKKHVLEQAKKFKYAFEPDRFQSDSEGYGAGSMASVALRFSDTRPDWISSMKMGKTPLQILLEGRSVTADEEPTELKKLFSQSELKVNADIGAWLEPEIQRLKSKKYVRVVFPYSSAVGSYSPKGFFLYKDLDGSILTFMPFASPYQFQTNGWSLNAEKDRVFWSGGPNPCESSAFTTLVDSSQMQTDGGKLKIALPDLHGEMNYETKTDNSGHVWFCGK